MLERINLVLIEDDAEVTDAFKHFAEVRGHSVTATADSLERAMIVVDGISRSEILADVVTLDANLSSSQKDGTDAQQIVNHMKELGVSVPIIGFSSISMESYGIDVDYDVGKDVLGVMNKLDEIDLQPVRKNHGKV